MKRCPKCNLRHDDALKFCRADGTPLVSNSGPIIEDAGTLKFGSAPGAGKIETRILTQAEAVTDEALSRTTTPPGVLNGQRASSNTKGLDKRKPGRGVIIAATSIAAVVIAASAYLYASRGQS